MDSLLVSVLLVMVSMVGYMIVCLIRVEEDELIDINRPVIFFTEEIKEYYSKIDKCLMVEEINSVEIEMLFNAKYNLIKYNNRLLEIKYNRMERDNLVKYNRELQTVFNFIDSLLKKY